MKTFYFNTGVRPENRMQLADGAVWRNGVMQFPFDCEDVPDGCVFAFAAPDGSLNENDAYIVRKMHNTTMASEYAYFKKPLCGHIRQVADKYRELAKEKDNRPQKTDDEVIESMTEFVDRIFGPE